MEEKVYLFLVAIVAEGTTDLKVKIPESKEMGAKAEQLEHISLEMAGLKDHSRAAKWDLKRKN